MNIEVFKFEKNEIRTQVDANGNPLFCVKDVCNGLFLTHVTNASKDLKENERYVMRIQTLGGEQNMLFTTETGLYKLIMQSRKQEAQNFKDWICETVLPSIRKTGSYSTEIVVPKTFKEALLMLVESEEQKEKMQLQITEMQPKVEFYDQVADSKDCLEMNQVAKVCNLGIGRNHLFEFLRDQKILMKGNVPYQKYIDCGYFKVIETTFDKNGESKIYPKTLVSQKGIEFIIKTYKNK